MYGSTYVTTLSELSTSSLGYHDSTHCLRVAALHATLLPMRGVAVRCGVQACSSYSRTASASSEIHQIKSEEWVSLPITIRFRNLIFFRRKRAQNTFEVFPVREHGLDRLCRQPAPMTLPNTSLNLATLRCPC